MNKRYCILFILFSIITGVTVHAQTPRLLWGKCYGGSGIDEAACVKQTSDGGFITVGYTESNNGDVSGLHDDTSFLAGDAWIVKTNDTGKIVWSRVIGGSYGDRLTSVQQTTDGGYIATGFTYSVDGDLQSKV